MECARLLSEAAEREPDVDGPEQVRDLYNSLATNFKVKWGWPTARKTCTRKLNPFTPEPWAFPALH